MTPHTPSQPSRQLLLSLVAVFLVFSTGAAQNRPDRGPKFSTAVAFDVSPAARDLPPAKKGFASSIVREVRPERGPVAKDKGFSGDAAVQGYSQTAGAQVSAVTIPSPLQNFEGLSNQDNFNTFGFRVNPPDPNGDVGPNHYVEMINLVFAVYSKTGNLLLDPIDTGSLAIGGPSPFGRGRER